ncbi:uncharacterized protein LOC101742910 [Bombyx mori]|uniref:Actin n=1 Tax=Bombyx mori TaxID=7091 RepID=A0A8R2APU0_BOMMO|nr:actin-85C [Bombyx mori]
MSFEKPAVVIDNGSYNIKAGFACDNHPVSIFRTVVGRPDYLHGSYGRQSYDVYIGDDAVSKIEDLELNKPVEKGRIVHWDNMERIWHHVFYKELKVAPEDRAVVLACTTTSPMEEKFKCCEVFFETLNVPALCIQPQAVLAVYGSGYTTGISVDLGYDTTEVTPVYQGGRIEYAHTETRLAGSQVSEYLKLQLEERGIDLGVNTATVIENIKRDCLYVTKDASMTRSDYEKYHRTADGDMVHVCREAFLAAELIFQPDLVMGQKTDFLPLPDAVVNAVLVCDAELRPDLYDAIVLCGGLAMIPGLQERLAMEVENLTQTPVNVIGSPEAYAVAWLGGATFAGLPDAKKMWVTKKQFEEYGEKIVRNKFL